MLFVPGSDESKLFKIGTLEASAYIIDLEDAVAPSAKAQARRLAAGAIARSGRTSEVWVRVNAVPSGMLLDDLDAIVAPGLAGVLLPKTESAEDLHSLDSLLTLLEARRGVSKGSVRVLPIVETVAGLSHVDDIASASLRISCLAFGAGDFSLDVGLPWPPPGGRLSQTIINAKAELVLASRRAGLSAPHDGVYPHFRKPDALRAEAEEALALGFGGKHAIHPNQLQTIFKVFRPSEEAVSEARQVLAAYERGREAGVGGVHIDGRFIDRPVAERARRVLAASGLDVDDVKPSALAQIRVIDVSSLLAGPLISTNLGDLGADVIKIEHPRGDDARRWGMSKNGIPLWWKTISRNKRLLRLDLNVEESRNAVRLLARDADVLIENFRPGRMESWGLGPNDLLLLNPRLIFIRVTGFGQTGPYADRPGFGTLAEAFSGFAHMTGEPDGPPTLPPFGLADGVAGLVGTYAALAALYWRDAGGGNRGQVIDLSLYEPLFSILGPQITEYTQLGVVQHRQGNRSPRTAPRNAYPTADDRWVVLSAGTQQIADRIFGAIERPELGRDARFRDAAARSANADAIDAIVGEWIASHSLADVLERFNEAQAPIVPVFDISQIHSDPHYRQRGSFIECPDPDLGLVTVAAMPVRLSVTPASVRWLGKTSVGADTADVVRELGLPITIGGSVDTEIAVEGPD